MMAAGYSGSTDSGWTAGTTAAQWSLEGKHLEKEGGEAFLMDLLLEDRCWIQTQLADQPTCETDLVEHLDRWLKEDLSALGLKDLHQEQTRQAGYLGRLWRCWRYHWRKAADRGQADGLEVARRVRSGRDAVTGKLLQGNPFRDVVLAEAVLEGAEPALRRLERDHRSLCSSLVRSILKESQPSPSWWPWLLTQLRGTPEKPGKLARFQGKCGLEPFLREVVKNLLLDLMREPSLSGPALEGELPSTLADPGPSPAHQLLRQECRDLLGALLEEGLAQLTQVQVCLLLLRIDQVPSEQIAAILGVAESSIHYRFFRAKEKLAGWLQGMLAQESPHREARHDCLAELSGPLASHVLREAIQRDQQRRLPS